LLTRTSIAPKRERSARHRRHRLLIGNIDAEAERHAASRRDRRCDCYRRGRVDIGRHHARTGYRKLLSVDLANALAAAGDDHSAAGEIKARIGRHRALADRLRHTPGEALRDRVDRQVAADENHAAGAFLVVLPRPLVVAVEDHERLAARNARRRP
jgi:hypothetical protein